MFSTILIFDFSKNVVVDTADVAVFHAVGPFHPLDVVGLSRCFVDFAVGLPNKTPFVDADVVADDVVVRHQSS